MPLSQDPNAVQDILIVDDTPENLRLLSTMLSKQGYHVRKSLHGQAALTAARTVPPDLILLDIMMPGMDGFAVCQQLKSHSETAEVPVIFLSALNEAFDKVKAFNVGGADYITKPFQLEEVLMRVKNQLTLRAWSKQMQHLNAVLEERVQERTRQLELANQDLVREISERKQAQAQLLEMALHDTLTGLPNRSLFMERLLAELKRCHSVQTGIEGFAQFAVLFLDCDRFKIINDSLGHLTGDELLIAIARRLEMCLKDGDTLARLGGDEFAILLPQLHSFDCANQVAEQILKELSYPFQLERSTVFISASLGIVQGSSEYEQPEHLLRDADTAMYHAKASGKGRYQVFDSTMHMAALQALQLETDLRQAIDQQQFMLHYQPIVSLSSGKISGVEALIRWQHPHKGMIAPGVFIPLAEETGLIRQLGSWVLRSACQQLKTWQHQGAISSDFAISVNLSGRQLIQADFIDQLDLLLDEMQIQPQQLKLEITESITVNSGGVTTQILQELKQRKIHLSIDDFGTGYSSLSYLHTLPIESLKIDRSFVQCLNNNSCDVGLIPAIVSMAQAMQLHVIAEGVETLQQLKQLRTLHCDFGQGYLFAKPLTAEQATTLLRTDPHW